MPADILGLEPETRAAPGPTSSPIAAGMRSRITVGAEPSLRPPSDGGDTVNRDTRQRLDRRSHSLAALARRVAGSVLLVLPALLAVAPEARAHDAPTDFKAERTDPRTITVSWGEPPSSGGPQGWEYILEYTATDGRMQTSGVLGGARSVDYNTGILGWEFRVRGVWRSDDSVTTDWAELTIPRVLDDVPRTYTANTPATGAPSISGMTRVGQTLTANRGNIADDDGLTGVSYSWQWVRVEGDGSESDISGATEAAYTVDADDVGRTLRVRASFSDGGGNSESRTSAATAVVTGAPPPAPPPPPTPTPADTPATPGQVAGQVTGVSVAAGAGQLTVTWTAVADATGYTVEWKSGSRDYDPSRRAEPSGTRHTIDGLLAGVEYTVRVIATVGAGPGEPSDDRLPGARGTPTATATLVLDRTTIDESGSGNRAVLTARLDAAAGAAVVLTMSADPASTVTLSSPATLTIPAGATASGSSGITVTAVNDDEITGTRQVALSASVSGGGSAVTVPRAVTLRVRDDDGAAATSPARGWLARFGRTVADQAVAAVGVRLEAASGIRSEMRIAGYSIAAGGLPASWEACGAWGSALGDRHAMGALETGESFGTGTGGLEDPCRSEARTLTGRDLLTGSSFAFTGGSTQTGFSTVWGSGAVTRFDGRDGSTTLDGEVASALVGADIRRGRATLGLAVAHSSGDGSYRGNGRGGVESTLTGVYPYGRYDVDARVTVWGVAGYGAGTLTLRPDGGGGIETDMGLMLGAAGLRGVLVEPSADTGVELAVKSDALAVRTSSDRAEGLADVEAHVTRLRLGLVGAWRGLEAGRGTLTPMLELGLRRDGGDAETGFGLEAGAGIAWHDPCCGIAAELRAHGVLTHEADGFRKRGLSGSFAWDPAPDTDRGLSLRLSQMMGASDSGGVQALFRDGLPTELATIGNGQDARRFEARLGYGVGAFGNRLTMTPEVGFGRSSHTREYGLGWRLNPLVGDRSSFELRLDATRREAANGDAEPEHGIELDLKARF